jgi:sugar transferase (PEP-CTERM/EpsH1 system associated)
MRVVHVLQSLDVGGLENGVVNVVNGLHASFEQAVVCVRGAGPMAARLPPDVPVVALERPAADRWTVLPLARALRALRPTVVHSRNWPAIEAVPAARLARVPVVLHGEHGREAADPDGLDRRRRRVRRLLSPLVDRFVTVSADLRRWLGRDVGIPERKLVTIVNGVDTERFAPGDGGASRLALGLAPGAPVVGTVGRLDLVKDHAGLLRAFARVRAAHPATVLVLAGDGPCRAVLARLAGQLGLGAAVRFLGLRPDVPAVLRALDVFVLPSIAEGISNTLLEAMATGLPVVATRVGGNPELVEADVTGTLVRAGDPAALAAGILRYVEDPHLRELAGKAARQQAVARFDLAGMLARYRELYAALARARGIR